MATSEPATAPRHSQHGITARLNARMALSLSVAPDQSADGETIVIQADCHEDDAELPTPATLALSAQAALDLAMQLISAVGRLIKLDVKDCQDRDHSPDARRMQSTGRGVKRDAATGL
jgi:hypothetical protein